MQREEPMTTEQNIIDLPLQTRADVRLQSETWHGAEFVTLGTEHMPWHGHPFGVDIPAHTHPLGSPLPGYVSNKSSSSGPYTLADQSSGITNTGAGGGGIVYGNTRGAGGGQPHFNIQPTTYVNYSWTAS